MREKPYFQQSETEFTVSHSNDYIWRMKEFHIHDFYEIYLSLTGDSLLFVEDKIYHIEKGDLFIFNSNDLHKVVVPPNRNYERYVFEFIPEFIQKFSTEQTDLLEYFADRPKSFTHQMHLDEHQLQEFIALFEKAIYYYHNPGYGHEISIKMALAELLLKVNVLYRSANALKQNASNQDYQKIKPVLFYINQNLSTDLSLGHLSNTFYISKQQLCMLFKKTTGFSVNEYIIHRRIMRAKELLKKNDIVSMVGEQVGYNNLSHFIRTFKKMTRISPKQYARKFVL